MKVKGNTFGFCWSFWKLDQQRAVASACIGDLETFCLTHIKLFFNNITAPEKLKQLWISELWREHDVGPKCKVPH